MAALCTATTAQTKAKKVPIADETFLSASGENNFKVQSSNEKITAMLLKKYEGKYLRYNVNFKTDRHGKYPETTIYFKNELSPEITAYLKSL